MILALACSPPERLARVPTPSQGSSWPPVEAAVPLRYSCASRRLPFEVWKLGTSNIVPLQRGEVKLLSFLQALVSWFSHRLGGSAIGSCHLVTQGQAQLSHIKHSPSPTKGRGESCCSSFWRWLVSFLAAWAALLSAAATWRPWGQAQLSQSDRSFWRMSEVPKDTWLLPSLMSVYPIVHLVTFPVENLLEEPWFFFLSIKTLHISA